MTFRDRYQIHVQQLHASEALIVQACRPTSSCLAIPRWRRLLLPACLASCALLFILSASIRIPHRDVLTTANTAAQTDSFASIGHDCRVSGMTLTLLDARIFHGRLYIEAALIGDGLHDNMTLTFRLSNGQTDQHIQQLLSGASIRTSGRTAVVTLAFNVDFPNLHAMTPESLRTVLSIAEDALPVDPREPLILAVTNGSCGVSRITFPAGNPALPFEEALQHGLSVTFSLAENGELLSVDSP